MASFVNAPNALAVAVEICRQGQALYLELKNRASFSQDKNLFAFMAEEELCREAPHTLPQTLGDMLSA